MVLLKIEKNDISYILKQKDGFIKQLRDAARGWERGEFYFTTDKKKKRTIQKDPVWKNKQRTHKETRGHIY